MPPPIASISPRPPARACSKPLRFLLINVHAEVEALLAFVVAAVVTHASKCTRIPPRCHHLRQSVRVVVLRVVVIAVPSDA
eukprot:7496194-Pyramimonas_sp.AAC.1